MKTALQYREKQRLFYFAYIKKIMGLICRKDFCQGNRPQFLPKE